MAGNKVVLTFAGESKSLEDTFDKVGRGAKQTGGDLEDSFDRVGSSADNLDTRAMGFRDTLTGVEDTGKGVSEIMKGNLFDGTLLLGMGFGDLASGVANFGTQFARQAGQFVANTARMVASHATAVASTVAGWVLMGIQATLNAIKMAAAWLISLGPIGLVIAAIGGITAILIALGVDFDTVKNVAGAAWELILGAAQGVWNWLSTNWPLVLAILTGPFGLAVLAISRNWESIKGGATAVKDWVQGRFNDLVSFITGLPGRISSSAGNMFNGVKESARGALNAIIGWWNGLSLTFPKVSLPGFLGGGSIGGWTLSTPNIPRLHQGGIMPGAPGTEGLALLQAGEQVIPAGKAQAPPIVIHVHGSVLSERDLVRLVSDELRRGGFGGVL